MTCPRWDTCEKGEGGCHPKIPPKVPIVSKVPKVPIVSKVPPVPPVPTDSVNEKVFKGGERGV